MCTVEKYMYALFQYRFFERTSLSRFLSQLFIHVPSYVIAMTLQIMKINFSNTINILYYTNSTTFTFGNIEIEEVQVQQSLYHSSNNGNPVIESLSIEPPHPIGYIQGTVATQGKQVMRRDGLSLSGLGYHVQLWHDGY